jgi:hypothetical protein
MRKTSPAVLVVSLLVVLAVVGVGAFFLLSGSDEEPSETSEGQEYVDALIATVNQDAPLAEDDVRCLAEAHVNSLGVEGLSEHATPEEIEADPEADLEDFGIEIDTDQATGIVDRSGDCGVDFREVMRATFVGLGASEDGAVCMVEQFSDDEVHQAMVTSFTSSEDDDETFSTQVNEAAAECGEG